MNGLEAWRIDLEFIGDRLMLGIEMFGSYADWLWAVPAFWVVAMVLLWGYMAFEQRRSDRAYLAYVAQRLPTLGHLARERAREVSGAGRFDERF